jgi:hypothetical protein
MMLLASPLLRFHFPVSGSTCGSSAHVDKSRLHGSPNPKEAKP